MCATSLLLRLLLRTLADIRRLLLLRCCCGRCCGCCCYGAPWWRLSSAHEVRLSRRSRALANARARRGAQQRRGREHAYVLDKPRMPMAVPSPLPIAICECRARCPSPSSAVAAATGARSCAATSSPRASSRARCATHADQTHQAAHGHRVPRRRPRARHPAPRGQAGEHARDLARSALWLPLGLFQ